MLSNTGIEDVSNLVYKVHHFKSITMYVVTSHTIPFNQRIYSGKSLVIGLKCDSRNERSRELSR